MSPLLALAHAGHRQIDDQLPVVMRMDVTDPEFRAEVRMRLIVRLERATLELT